MANKIQFEHLQKWKKEQRKQKQILCEYLRDIEILLNEFCFDVANEEEDAFYKIEEIKQYINKIN
jgi:hypothetical protein